MASNEDARAAREAKLDELHEKLTGAVEQLVSGDDWRDALAFAERAACAAAPPSGAAVGWPEPHAHRANARRAGSRRGMAVPGRMGEVPA